MVEKSSNEIMHVFTLDFDSDAIHLGYPRYAECYGKTFLNQFLSGKLKVKFQGTDS